MNRREFVGTFVFSVTQGEPIKFGVECPVCDKMGFTAEQADWIEETYEKYMGGTCCYKVAEEELYIHPKWLQ